MANARGKTVDTTHLGAETYIQRQILHRDILAHHMRWTHVANYIRRKGRYKTAHFLDVGCGIDVPLARMLFTNRTAVENYVGVDYNKPQKFDLINFGRMPVHAYGGVDFAKHVIIDQNGYHVEGFEDEVHPYPSVVVSFEVLEHVEPEHARRMAAKMLELIEKGQEFHGEAHAFISTPCWDPHVGAAKNHVSEIKRQALGAMFEDLGFSIVGNWGTFASMKDYKDKFFKEGETHKKIWDKLSEYYDSNYLATVFAPMYPQHSRNNLWKLAPLRKNYERKFPPLSEVEGPWTSSQAWEGLKG